MRFLATTSLRLLYWSGTFPENRPRPQRRSDGAQTLDVLPVNTGVAAAAGVVAEQTQTAPKVPSSDHPPDVQHNTGVDQQDTRSLPKDDGGRRTGTTTSNPDPPLPCARSTPYHLPGSETPQWDDMLRRSLTCADREDPFRN
jgi:hypothetical protein